MARKRTAAEEWISGNDAAAILSENSGYEISSTYVRLLASKGVIRSRAKDGRTKEYYKSDVAERKITPKTKEARERLATTNDQPAA